MLVNGKSLEHLKVRSVSALLEALKLSQERVVVELNGDIISKEHYEQPLLDEKSVIEIVRFVGGG